jgi:hypothetical protein
VDPANRLVAATLESRWNDALVKLEELKQQFADFQRKETRLATPEEKKKVLALARDFPRLWNAPTTKPRDRKRMLRLLIKDITVEKIAEPRQALLHIRWQGCACETVAVDLPRRSREQPGYPQEIVERVRGLARTHSDAQIAAAFNLEGRLSSNGKPFSAAVIAWIRIRHKISAQLNPRPDEHTVEKVTEKFCVSPNVVYDWIERGVVQARRKNRGTPLLITIDPQTEAELKKRIRESTRIKKNSRKQ